MAKKFFTERRPHEGLDFYEFLQNTEQKINSTNTDILNEEEKHLFEYTKLNLQRMTRILKTYKINPDLEKKIKSILERQIWMVLTEDWCGDSAQNLPYLFKFAECNDLIEFKILERDKNLDIMDEYLTNGTSRSIPKLVVFNENGKELFTWGARPQEADDLVQKWKAEGLQKEEFLEKLHLWYGRNKGKALEQEFLELL